MNKKYLYIGLIGLSVIGVGYLLLGNKKDDEGEDKSEEGSDDNISKEQETIPTNVQKGLKVGDKIYAKLDEVTNIRNSAEVNNGWINNIWFELPSGSKGLYLGKITKIYTRQSTGKIWYKFDVSNELWSKFREESSAITRPFSSTPPKGFAKYVRQDTITSK